MSDDDMAKLAEMIREMRRKNIAECESAGMIREYDHGRQRGAFDGEVIRVGGIQKWIPIMLRSETTTYSNFFCRPELAKQLGRHLFEPVRLFGSGRWNRDAEGLWSLEYFSVDSFDPLREETLSQAIARIAAIKGEWVADSISELNTLRHNGDVGNGGT